MLRQCKEISINAWSLVYPGLAWIFIPLPINYEFYGIHYNSWRIFLAFIGVPTFIIAMIILFKYPESPKFLVSQGRTDEALVILRKIYAVNNQHDESEYPVSNYIFILLYESLESAGTM